ncbi:serpin family protein, partial [Endozoicomonas sp. ONNA1]
LILRRQGANMVLSNKSPVINLQYSRVLLSVSLLHFLSLPSPLQAETCDTYDFNQNRERFSLSPAFHEKNPDEELQYDTMPSQSAIPANPDSNPCSQSDESQGNLELAINIFSQAAKETPENFLISPDGLFRSLALILMGATGETRRLLQSYLGDNYSESSGATASIATSFARDEYFIENCLLLSSELELRETYRERLKQINADIRDKVDFFDRVFLQNLADELNRLFSQLTHGMVPQFCHVDQWPPDTTLALINSIYFKGLWERSFNVRNTGVFTLPNNQRVVLEQFMEEEISSIQYTNHNDWEAVTVPYQGAHEMILVLPPEGIMPHEISPKIIKALFSSLNSEESRPSYSKISLGLPPFKVDSNIELKKFFDRTGLHSLFTNPLELGTMLSVTLPVYINVVRQHCAIEVNKDGTRAAAVTHMSFSRSFVESNQRKSIQFSRPFLYMLHNKITKKIIIIGQLLDPRSTSGAGTH